MLFVESRLTELVLCLSDVFLYEHTPSWLPVELTSIGQEPLLIKQASLSFKSF